MDKKEKNKLTDEENRKLIRAYRETGDEYYKEKFFVKNDRLCFHMVQKYLNTRLPLEELVSLARFGMLKAFDTFDLEKDVRFVSYASRCMNNEILAFLRKNKKHSGVASLEERTNVNKDGKELTLLDIIKGESSYDIDRMVMREGISHLFKELRKTLSELEYNIIVNLISDNPKKQRKIAEEWGLTQSYVSRDGILKQSRLATN